MILRFPARLFDLDGVQRYCGSEAASAWSSGEHVVVAAVAEDEETDFDGGGEGVLASILPVRSEILAGDERALYLLWLLGVQTGEIQEDVVEPSVPPGLDLLTGSQAALVEFLRIDGELVVAAAAGSMPRSRASVDVGEWVAGLAAAERDELLVALLRGDDPHVGAETLRRLRPAVVDGGAPRTARQLADAATSRRDERERGARVRREQAAAERDRRMLEARRERLAALAAEGEAAWDRVATRIAEKKPAGYDAAVELLVDLQEMTGKVEFARVEALRAEHRRKPGLIGRLAAAGL